MSTLQKAISLGARGDLNAAERWFRIADRAVAIAQRLREMERPQERSRWTVERNPV
jgi:hypothetical protein